MEMEQQARIETTRKNEVEAIPRELENLDCADVAFRNPRFVAILGMYASRLWAHFTELPVDQWDESPDIRRCWPIEIITH